MRLNGWQRIGVVLSVLWFVGGYLGWIAHENADWGRSYRFAYSACEGVHHDDCGKEAGDYAQIMNPDRVLNAALFATLPIPFAWLLTYGLLALVRWVRKGFRPASEMPVVRFDKPS